MSPPINIPAVSPAAPVVATVQSADPAVAHSSDPATRKDPAQTSQDNSARQAEHMKADLNMVHLGYTVDHESNSLKIRVTNQESGEVVREFELKGLGAAHHEPLTTKGVVVDDQT